MTALGATVLLGRLAGWAPLVTVIPNGAPMAFSTAVAFGLSGASFFAHGCGARRIARAAAAIVLVVSVCVTGLEIARLLLGLEEFFFDPRQLIVTGTTFGGRMSLNSAVSFALLAAALWLLGAERIRLTWVVGLASVVLGISAVALLSYFTGLRWSVWWWRVTAMAVHTSAGFGLAAAALFAWVVRLARTPRLATWRTLPFFAGAGTALLVLGIVMLVGNEHRREIAREVVEALDNLHNAADARRAEAAQHLVQLQAEAVASERTVRGVLLAGVLIAIALVLVAFRLVGRAQLELQRANEALEDRVRERTAELEASVAQVHEREHRLRFLADSLPQLVWTARPDGAMETLNRGYLEYLGVATEAEGLAALTNVVHPDDRAIALREWAAMFRERRSGGGELRLRRVDGVHRWHLWRAHPECDAAGRIARWVGTSTDIHEKKIFEEQLEQRVEARTAELVTSEERFRQAFQFAGIGMAIVGLDGRFVRVNRSLCETVGYAEEELLQKTFQEITHPDDLEADLAHVRELREGRRRFFQMEKRYFHRDGHTVWIRLTASIVRDADAAPVHFVSQIEDITERKRLEANLASARDHALEASRLKSEFLATMSHEIRTPMNGVIGMTSLLRHTPLTPSQAQYVRTIETSGEVLLAIIDDILDYSKIEAGRMELEVVRFDLRECIGGVLDLFAARAAEKKIRLASALSADVPAHVAGDVTRLRQILVNLVGNAVKFTEAGEVVVRVSAEASPIARPGRAPLRLSFAVQDTGIGIAPEGMPRLFKSFSQVDPSTTRRFGGTGLGLAISKRLAELMGGSMWAESVPGRGSTFCFNVTIEPADSASPVTRNPAGAGFARNGGEERLGERYPLRLLLAEDNPLNQRVANLLLERLGYRAQAVVNGQEALAAVSAADYDVILMDIEMPELDGCEATRRIRALRRSSTRPWIIALTAGATAEHRERAMAAGMNDYLTKPARPEIISAALVRAYGALNAAAAPQL